MKICLSSCSPVWTMELSNHVVGILTSVYVFFLENILTFSKLKYTIDLPLYCEYKYYWFKLKERTSHFLKVYFVLFSSKLVNKNTDELIFCGKHLFCSLNFPVSFSSWMLFSFVYMMRSCWRTPQFICNRMNQ